MGGGVVASAAVLTLVTMCRYKYLLHSSSHQVTIVMTIIMGGRWKCAILHTIYLLTSRYYANTEWCGVYHGTAGALPGWSRAGGELQSGTRGGDPASTGCRLGLVDTVDTPCRYYTALTMSPPAACVMCRYICISMPSVAWCRYLLYLHTAAAVASAMNTGLALGWG